MKRTIKLRRLVQNKKTKETKWFYWNISEGEGIGLDPWNIWMNLSDWEQFTGLHDKNGKEIYEGDEIIVNCGDYISDPVIIEYYGAAFRIAGFAPDTFPDGEDIEVIGNIHEKEV